MKFTVYILYSEKFNKHYTGFTSNLETRIKSHNELGKDWTAKYRPWKLIFTQEFTSKTEAMTYEKWLKTGLEEILLNHYLIDMDLYPPRRTAVQVCSPVLIKALYGAFFDNEIHCLHTIFREIR